jgi:hypothetical protein
MDRDSGRPSSLTLDSLVVATDGQATCDLAGEAVVLDVSGGLYYGLNEVGARIWRLVREPIRVEAILETLVDEYEVDPATCSRDLLRVLGALQAAGLVEVRDGRAA